MKMPATNKLRQKIKTLETERTTLKNEIAKLRLEAEGKTLMLEQKVKGLAEKADSLRQLMLTS